MQMKPPKPIANTAIVKEEATQKWFERKSRLVHDGQIAADRLLLYLRRFNFPESQALDLALRAIRKAKLNTAPGRQTNPVAEAMEALLRLLREEPGAAAHSRLLNGRCEPPVASQPPVHRLHMVPEELYPTKTMRHWAAARRTSTPAKRAKNGGRVSA